MSAISNGSGRAGSVAVRITECDHVANAFWTLGIVVHEVPAQALFDSLPEVSCGYPATHEHSCFMADLVDAGGSVVDDREITEALAQTLLDEPIPVLRERFRAWLWETHGATG